MVRVLLVEDDSIIARIIQYYLNQESFYEVVLARTAGEAMALSRDHFDVILLDVMLPDVSGIELCGKLREWHDCPVIFISCLDDSSTIVSALEMGGDDFITKPFDNKVLAARIQANLRRAASSAPKPKKNILSCKGFSLDANRQLILRDEKEYKLSPMEFRVLLYLMQNSSRIVSREELLDKLWGYDCSVETRTLDIHIKTLRQKLGSAGSEYIKTIRSVGYRFILKEE